MTQWASQGSKGLKRAPLAGGQANTDFGDEALHELGAAFARIDVAVPADCGGFRLVLLVCGPGAIADFGLVALVLVRMKIDCHGAPLFKRIALVERPANEVFERFTGAAAEIRTQSGFSGELRKIGFNGVAGAEVARSLNRRPKISSALLKRDGAVKIGARALNGLREKIDGDRRRKVSHAAPRSFSARLSNQLRWRSVRSPRQRAIERRNSRSRPFKQCIRVAQNANKSRQSRSSHGRAAGRGRHSA